MTHRIGVVDTTFASVDMGAIVVRALQAEATGFRVERYTVPGIKDLAVACRRLFDAGCDLVVACGMPGPEPVDKQSAHVASTGLQYAQVLAGRHVVEVFVHLDEARDARELASVVQNRCEEHARNALALLRGPTALTPRAGTGRRQGFADVGDTTRGFAAGATPFAAKDKGTGADVPGLPASGAAAKSGGNAGKH